MAVRKVDGRFTKVRKQKTPFVDLAPDLPAKNSQKMTLGNWVEVLALVVATTAAAVSLWQTRILIDTIDTPYKANLQTRQIDACKSFIVDTRKFERSRIWAAGLQGPESLVTFKRPPLVGLGEGAVRLLTKEEIKRLEESNDRFISEQLSMVSEVIDSADGLSVYFNGSLRNESYSLTGDLGEFLSAAQFLIYQSVGDISERGQENWTRLLNDVEEQILLLRKACDDIAFVGPRLD